jgi:hypothetical protein
MVITFFVLALATSALVAALPARTANNTEIATANGKPMTVKVLPGSGCNHHIMVPAALRISGDDQLPPKLTRDQQHHPPPTFEISTTDDGSKGWCTNWKMPFSTFRM